MFIRKVYIIFFGRQTRYHSYAAPSQSLRKRGIRSIVAAELQLLFKNCNLEQEYAVKFLKELHISNTKTMSISDAVYKTDDTSTTLQMSHSANFGTFRIVERSIIPFIPPWRFTFQSFRDIKKSAWDISIKKYTRLPCIFTPL